MNNTLKFNSLKKEIKGNFNILQFITNIIMLILIILLLVYITNPTAIKNMLNPVIAAEITDSQIDHKKAESNMEIAQREYDEALKDLETARNTGQSKRVIKRFEKRVEKAEEKLLLSEEELKAAQALIDAAIIVDRELKCIEYGRFYVNTDRKGTGTMETNNFSGYYNITYAKQYNSKPVYISENDSDCQIHYEKPGEWGPKNLMLNKPGWVLKSKGQYRTCIVDEKPNTLIPPFNADWIVHASTDDNYFAKGLYFIADTDEEISNSLSRDYITNNQKVNISTDKYADPSGSFPSNNWNGIYTNYGKSQNNKPIYINEFNHEIRFETGSSWSGQNILGGRTGWVLFADGHIRLGIPDTREDAIKPEINELEWFPRKPRDRDEEGGYADQGTTFMVVEL